jgi:hypothetical protein
MSNLCIVTLRNRSNCFIVTLGVRLSGSIFTLLRLTKKAKHLFHHGAQNVNLHATEHREKEQSRGSCQNALGTVHSYGSKKIL